MMRFLQRPGAGLNVRLFAALIVCLTIATTVQSKSPKHKSPTTPVTDGAQAVHAATSSACGSTADIKVIIHNTGSSVLTSVTVRWSVNNTVMPAFQYAGSLNSNEDSEELDLGTATLTAPDTFAVKVWTDLPNNNSTPGYAVDTLRLAVNQKLSGQYTIGGGSASFPTIKSATDYLHQAGVCGPVDFYILPGIYTEKLSIRSVPGISSVNAVSFQPQGDSTSVTIQENSDVAEADVNLGYYVVLLDSVSDVTLSHLNFKTTGVNTVVVKFNNKTDRIKVIKNNFQSAPYSSQNNAGELFSIIYFSAGNFAAKGISSGDVVQGNYFSQATYGIVSNGVLQSSLIADNTFINQGQSAIVLPAKNYSMTIRHNKIITGSSLVAVQIYTAHGTYEISGNTISGNFQRGLELRNSGIGSDNIRVFNNSIAGDSSTTTALLSSGNRHTNYYFNSVRTSSLSATSNAFFADGDSLISIQNNNIVNGGTGASLAIGNSLTAASIDYNNYFSSGANLFTINPTGTLQTVADLTSFQQLTGYDAHSVTIDPRFIDAHDLHSLNTQLKGKGIPVAGITVDIDGEVRNATTPDPGSDEIAVYGIDVSVYQLPAQPLFFCSPNSQAYGIKIDNDGLTAVTSLRIDWSVNGTAKPFRQWTGNLASGSSFIYYFTGETFPVEQLEHLAVNVSQVNGGADQRPSTNSISQDITLYKPVKLSGDIETCEQTVAIVPPAGYQNYSWTIDQEFFTNEAAVNAETSGVYALHVSDYNGCTSTDSITFTSHYILASLNITKSPFICGGDTIIIRAPLDANYSYQWLKDGVNVTDSTTSHFTAKETGNYSVSIHVATCEYNSEALPVSVTPIIPISIQTAGSFVVCDGASVIIEADPANDDVFAYVWKKDDVVVSTFSSSSFAVKEAGVYTVTITRQQCSYTSAGVQIDSAPSPVATITASGGQLIAPPGADSYQWYENDELLTDSTEQQIRPSASGSFKVAVTKGICTTTSAAFSYVFTGLEEALALSVTVYPNPTERFIKIHGGKLLSGVKLQFEDLNGKAVATPLPRLIADDVVIDLEGVRGGVYFLRIWIGESVVTKKVVVVR